MDAKALYCGAWNFKGEVCGLKTFLYDGDSGTWKAGPTAGQDWNGQSILALSGKSAVSVCELGNAARVILYEIQEDLSLRAADVLELESFKLSYIVFSPDGRYAYASSMGDGRVRMFRIAEGKITMTDEYQLTGHSVTLRQSVAKVHSVMISPDGKTLAAANLGADELELFAVDTSAGRLRLIQSLPVDFGREPRHLAFSPDGDMLYLLTEGGNRIYVYRFREGRLAELAAYNTRDTDQKPEGAAADIVVSRDGRFIYSTNRGQSNIALWKALPSGLLDLVGHFPCGGRGPRGLNLCPDGTALFCANNDDGTVAVLPVDPQTGIPGAPTAILPVPSAGCVRSL